MRRKGRQGFSLIFACWVVCCWLAQFSLPVYAGSPGDGGTLTNQIYLPLVANTDGAAPQNLSVIPGQYIVVFNDDRVAAATVSAIAAEMVAANDGELLQAYDSALHGFAARFPVANSAKVVAQLQQDTRVAYVEQDTLVTLSQETNLDALGQADTVQTGAVWGLDRLDQRQLPLSGTFSYNKTGAGVRAYIIDTGINTAHTQFGTPSRASSGYDAVDGSLPAADCNGHGTHVAGTIGGSTYGVAKGVSLIAVRVLDCAGSGSTSGIIAGVNWVKSQKQASIPAVANMSLDGSYSSSLNTAVTNAINAGVTFVVAAGNSNANACNYSPASASGAVTVGATSNTDTRASFSNYGVCVDLFAPGVSITSAWYSSNTATAILSGTSMATPHVVGVVALYLQGHATATPATVRSAIFTAATAGIVKSPGTGSYNRLVFTSY